MIMYNELYHHGIKGMRWGVRHDKPSSGNRKRLSRAERRAARQRELRAAQQNRAKRAAAQTRERRAQQFNQNVKDNWYKPYNKASKSFNKNLESINSRYSKLDVNDAGEYTTLEGYNYIKEIDNLWQTAYSQALLSEFGEHPTFGKKWVEEAPFMDSYIPEYWVEKSVIDAAKEKK